MTYTAARTTTYTKVDIEKTFESFGSVLRMISLSSRCDDGRNSSRVYDILTFAYMRYLSGVDVILRDGRGERVRIARFTVSEDAADWSSDMPGDNIWPITLGGSISLVAYTTEAWEKLSMDRRSAFLSSLKLSWGGSNEDAAIADMEAVGARRYQSNAYGLAQTTFKRRGSP